MVSRAAIKNRQDKYIAKYTDGNHYIFRQLGTKNGKIRCSLKKIKKDK